MKLLNRYILLFTSIRYIGLILFFSSLTFKALYCQDTLQGSIKPWEKSYSEELLINTDRDLYISGEKVWVKIYKLNSLNHTPENLSKVVYVELLDAENNPVIQQKIGIDGYSGSAGFRLPDTLSTGNYFIRSCTRWMQNFAEELFSYKKISVINPFKVNGIKIPSTGQVADSVVFYPEGGNLIAGTEGVLGFRIWDKEREPVVGTGTIINSEDDTLCRVQSGNQGYGWIRIKPSGNSNLYLVTRDEYGSIRKFQLPPVKKEGIILTVTNKNEKSPPLVRMRLTSGFIPADTNLSMVLSCTGLPELRKKLALRKDREIAIPGTDMPAGLAHIMIVDGQGTHLAERWVYNETGSDLNYHIDIPKKAWSSREKIEMSITATDSRGNPVESDFSVSVAKAVTVSGKNSESNKYRQLPGLIPYLDDNQLHDINDWLLFYDSNDLKPDHGYKFTNGDSLYLPELEGHLINGTIKNRKTGEPVINENISLSFVGKTASFQIAKTNTRGEFHFKTTEHGLREIVIQPLSDKITDYYIELDNPFIPATKRINHTPFVPDSSRLADINNVIIGMQINNIYEPYAQAAESSTPVKAKPDFYGKPDNTILLSKYIELTSLKEVVKEIIPGVSTVKKNDKINFKLYYQYQSEPFQNNPLVLVDGVPVYDLEKVISINSRDLEKIDVFTTRYYLSDIVMDGILHFVTKKGNLDVMDLDRSVYRVQYDLLQNKDPFRSPAYQTAGQRNDRIPDFRNTLYWNPDMHTGKSGKATAEFYSSDESGEYTITIEGTTKDGLRGTARIPLTVGMDPRH